MRISTLIPIISFLSGAIAAPVYSVQKRALPRLGGVNLAGCEFGMTVWGWTGTPYCPGTEQISHFTKQGANLFRIPIGWQYLVRNNPASTSFDESYFAKFDSVVKASLAAGAYVMIDLHNYGRWDSGIVGQGGPSNQDFANVWSGIAKRYASQDRVIFGIMNEPHDLDINLWGPSVQAAVNAIRAAGATSQSIALPGNFWTHAEEWYNGKNGPVMAVTDPAGADNSKLIIDVHQYLDGDGSGTSRECTTNGIDKLSRLASWLNQNKRKALISEIGGGNTASCQQYLGEYLKYVSTNSAFIGFAAWSAGSFDAGYELSLTPQNGQDNALWTKAVKPYLPGAVGSAPTSAASSSTVAPTSSSSRSPALSSSSTRAPVSSSSAVSTSNATTRPVASSSTLPTTTKTPATTAAPVTSSSTSSSATSAAPIPSSVAGNFQKFTGTLGGAAPAVTKSGSAYITGTRSFNFLVDAVNGSCYLQMDACQSAANKGGNKAPLTVDSCSTQMQACLKVAAS